MPPSKSLLPQLPVHPDATYAKVGGCSISILSHWLLLPLHMTVKDAAGLPTTFISPHDPEVSTHLTKHLEFAEQVKVAVLHASVPMHKRRHRSSSVVTAGHVPLPHPSCVHVIVCAGISCSCKVITTRARKSTNAGL